jgi:hypothetical protein
MLVKEYGWLDFNFAVSISALGLLVQTLILIQLRSCLKTHIEESFASIFWFSRNSNISTFV